jgi:hypothetical protein
MSLILDLRKDIGIRQHTNILLTGSYSYNQAHVWFLVGSLLLSVNVRMEMVMQFSCEKEGWIIYDFWNFVV